MNQWTSLLTRKGRDALQDALSKKKIVEVELQVPSMRLRILISTQRAAPVWKMPMVLRLERWGPGQYSTQIFDSLEAMLHGT